MQNQAIIPTSTKRSYKSAGTHWITTIPTDWRMQRVKSLLGERNERGHPSEPLLAATQSQGVVLKEKYDSRTVLPSNEVDQFKLVREGDFVISLRSFQGGIEYTYDQGIISPAYTVIYPYNPLTRDYFARLFKSRPFVQNLTTCVTGIREGQNIDYTRLQVQTIPVPPPDEQAAIARFLDHADDQIQRYIASKERLIALLEEERQAIIHQAVTRGLDPNVKLKPSGVEWLGDVPKHWQLTTVKRHYQVQLGKMLQPRPNSPADVQVPYLKAQHVHRDHIRIETPPTMWATPNELERFGIRQGDVLIVEGGAGAGTTSLLQEVPDGYIIQNAIHRVRPRNQTRNELLTLIMEAVASSGWIDAINNKATIPHFTKEKLDCLPITLPTITEQNAIVEYSDKATTAIEQAIAHARRQIELMEEYRTRLIADVVTGQLDVREAAEELPTPEPTEITD